MQPDIEYYSIQERAYIKYLGFLRRDGIRFKEKEDARDRRDNFYKLLNVVNQTQDEITEKFKLLLSEDGYIIYKAMLARISTDG